MPRQREQSRFCVAANATLGDAAGVEVGLDDDGSLKPRGLTQDERAEAAFADVQDGRVQSDRVPASKARIGWGRDGQIHVQKGHIRRHEVRGAVEMMDRDALPFPEAGEQGEEIAFAVLSRLVLVVNDRNRSL